jgi:hypothetical protein
MSVYSRITGEVVLLADGEGAEEGGPPWLWSYTQAPAGRGQHNQHAEQLQGARLTPLPCMAAIQPAALGHASPPPPPDLYHCATA